MIRINLLEETRTASKRKGGGGGGVSMPSFDVADNVGVVIMFAGILLAAGIVGVIFMIKAAVIADLDDKIEEAKAEKKRLEYVLKRNEELKAKKKELTKRIDIISKLKENQDKPVRMMLEVGKELDSADNVWFEDLNFSGDKLKLQGKALSKFNYSKFLKNLEDSPCFDDVRSGIIEEKPGPEGQTLVSFRTETDFVVDCGASAAAAEKSGQNPPGRP